MIEKIKTLIKQNNIDLAKQLLTSIDYKIDVSLDMYEKVKNYILEFLCVDDYEVILEKDYSFYNSPIDWSIKMKIDSCYDEYDYYGEDQSEWVGCSGTKILLEFLGHKPNTEDYCIFLDLKSYSDQAGGMLSNNFKTHDERKVITFTSDELDEIVF